VRVGSKKHSGLLLKHENTLLWKRTTSLEDFQTSEVESSMGEWMSRWGPGDVAWVAEDTGLCSALPAATGSQAWNLRLWCPFLGVG
jgi:hypothetical protein